MVDCFILRKESLVYVVLREETSRRRPSEMLRNLLKTSCAKVLPTQFQFSVFTFFIKNLDQALVLKDSLFNMKFCQF